MSETHFDPFGEPVAQAPRGEAVAPAAGSAGLMRAGTALFWLLVVGILTARVAYFDPDFAERFGSFAALSNTLQALLNG
ncbi:hypothetical protein [Methylobacterium planeticum]|uniref:Uncharacterized protein n=1 Tax=Methylobacterium planeticum TaxID=2615211 RepID=A0A6N6MWT8_9HYPH|nr:hypothetical protein [Methylobacterium planeticum]KAB1074350.1 hypothetical protein F6X51_08230 [Methylobacterium planeticum]